MYETNRLDLPADETPGTCRTCPCCNHRADASTFVWDGYGWTCRDQVACDARALAQAIMIVEDPDPTAPLELPF